MIKDIKGQKFGKLTALEFVEVKNRNAYWKCLCDCGNEVIVLSNNLHCGGVKSCGCLKRTSHTKHREGKTRLYVIWAGMKQRCCNPNRKDYAKYGGRGINVCDEWKSDYLVFRDWAYANGYDDTKSIDRIDNDGDYSPQNCRWESYVGQENNKRNNHYLEINGATKSIADWSRESGISADRIRKRLNLGWTNEDAVFEPIDLKHKH